MADKQPREDFGLKVQSLSRQADQVLVFGRVAELRNFNGSFSRREIDELFEAFRIPRPGDTARVLRKLRDQRPASVIQRSEPGKWSLTPLGKRTSENVVGHIDPHQISAELAPTSGADFASAQHFVIPPMFAPQAWGVGISHLLTRFPFETNVFLMTRFPSTQEGFEILDPISGVIDAVREALFDCGLQLHLASDRQSSDDLLGNVAAHMWACRYGIGLLEDRVSEGINDNVILELGAMLMSGRRCALLKDKRLDRKNIPSDLVGQIYKSVDFDDLDEVRQAISLWVQEDLNLS